MEVQSVTNKPDRFMVWGGGGFLFEKPDYAHHWLNIDIRHRGDQPGERHLVNFI